MMNLKFKILFSVLGFTFFSILRPAFSQSVEAGEDMFVNWEANKTITLQGKVSAKKASISWKATPSDGVVFENPDQTETKVTFSRPGYYLISLTAVTKEGQVSDELILNVYTANEYQSRLNDLVSLMTVEEKIDQLVNESEAIPRLGLPEYNYWNEALHGVRLPGATSFPQAIALGATWDPELINNVSSVISEEARVKNNLEGDGLTYWSPTVNIARDPRWGRNEESYSEDPYLLSKMGVAFIKGMQGDHPYYFKTIATPKHFIANNEEVRRHSGSSDVDMRSLWEYYMPAFEQAIVQGKAYSIMGAYNELNNVPSCGNYYLLTDVLRRKWGFEGYVVSDCGAINDMVNGHKFFNTGAEASARGILAGCDLNCGDYYKNYLKEALDSGYVDEKDLDVALKRVLSARFRLGEFDPAEIVPYKNIPDEKLDCSEHRALALEAAQKSIVLLKNDGILPLDPVKIKSVAIIGPNAEACELGIYSGTPNICISPLEGIQKKASEFDIKTEYTEGSQIGGGLMIPIDKHYFGKVEGSDKTGMKGEYFDNMNLEGAPVFTRIDSMVNFSFGGAPGAGVSEDFFSVRWTGTIIPPETRTYKFGTRSDDGARLYLDGKLLIDDWNDHGEKPNSVKIDLEAGKEYKVVFEFYDNILGASARLMWDLGSADYEQAKEVAKDKDVVVLVLGTIPGLSEEELDREDISLPEMQRELINEVAKVNKNIVVVLVNGGPLAMMGSEENASAIVETWFNGQSGGEALANVLFGDVNPGGKLPSTFYASTEQLPPFADYDLINNARTYMYFEDPVLYPFGHGLSYTTFKYENIGLSSESLKDGEELTISCTVKNAGTVDGDEVVQVYVKDLESSVKMPIKKLIGFKRISLKAGESKDVEFVLSSSQLSFYDIDSNEFITEPGAFEIMIGSSSADIRLKKGFDLK